jgi:DNA-binding MarR family transcriptional regulator
VAARRDPRQELESAKRASLGHLLLRAARLWNERAVARVQRDQPGFRIAHTLLFPHVDFEGTRITDLAARLGISKQAVGKLVAELEGTGVLEARADPRDGRAKRVRFTRRGTQALVHGLARMEELSAEVEAELGAAELRRLRAALARLVAALER